MADAFDALRRTSPATGPRPAGSGPSGARVADVEALIARARGHALGLDFLLRGAPDAVAMTFGVHAFVVDAARDRLAAARERSASAGPAR